MKESRYGEYLVRDIIGKSKYPEITSPIVKYQGDKGYKDVTFEWNCITKPFTMSDEPSVNEFDQYLYFGGTNLDDRSDFQAEVEMSLGEDGQRQAINEPKIVYIPKGLVHGPVRFKKINKPIVFMDFHISPEKSIGASVKSEYGKLVVNPLIETGGFHNICTTRDGKPFTEQHIKNKFVSYNPDDYEVHGRFRFIEWTIKHWFLQGEPFHTHFIDKLVVVMGADPTNVGKFDAELDMFIGKEEEKVVLDSTSVFRIAKGMRHGHLLWCVIKKPIWFFLISASTVPEYSKEDVSFKAGNFIVSKGSPLEEEVGSRED